MTAAARPPVEDFSTDFDHTDPTWVRDPFPIWEDLRGRCPVAHSDRYGGVWLPTRHEDISAIAYDTEHFSSQGVVVSELKPDEPAPIGGAPPITSDPPFHAFARRLLLPAFAPRPIQDLEPATRQLCRDLLDGIAGRLDADGGLCDAALDYAQNIPPAVIARMLGLPPEDDELFRGFIHDVLENLSADEATREAKFENLDTYLDRHVADHEANPRDDLISYLLDVEIEGSKLSPEHVRGTVILLLIAGIDTTWSAIGAALWHLASHPDDRRRLAGRPRAARRGGRGAPAGVRAGDHGPDRGQGRGAGRPRAQGRGLGAAALPRRQPGSRGVRGRRSGGAGPRRQPPHARSGWASTAAWAPTWPAWS